MSNIYCGVGEPKSNQKLGTKEDCIKKNQIRLYGLNKITLEDIENVRNGKKSSKKSSSKKENLDEKYSIREIKKMKLGLDIHKNEIYMLNKKKNSSKTGKLSKTDQKKYDEHMKFINKAQKYLNDALNYHRKKKAAKSSKK